MPFQIEPLLSLDFLLHVKSVATNNALSFLFVFELKHLYTVFCSFFKNKKINVKATLIQSVFFWVTLTHYTKNIQQQNSIIFLEQGLFLQAF